MRGPHQRRAAVPASLIVGLTLVTILAVLTPLRAGGQLVRTSTIFGPQAQAPSTPTKAASTKAASPRSFEVKVINGQTGRPEPGVSIRLSMGLSRQGATDAEGRFRVTDIERELVMLRLEVEKPGFVPLQVMWDNARAEVPVEIPREYTIKIEPGSVIGGIVQDAQGQPVAGARIRLSVPITGGQRAGEPRVNLMNHSTNTDADGRWRFDTLPAELSSVSITVDHPDYLAETVQFRPGSQSTRELAQLKSKSALVVLRKGLTLEGRVINSEGNPVAKAEVALSRAFRQGTATTDDEGRFELDRVRPGSNEVVIRAKGYVPALQHVEAAVGMAPVEFRLETGGMVTGRVVDEDNKPVAGATVQLQIGSTTLPVMGFPVTSGQDGRFQIDGVPATGGTLVVRRQFNMVTRHVVPSEKDETFVLAGPKPKTLRITVTDAESGEPVRVFNVVLRGLMMGRHSATGGRYESTVSVPSSRQGFPPLQIRIEATGYLPSELRRVQTDGAEIDLKFELKKGTGVAGLVRTPDGSPAVNADLAVRRPSERIDLGDGQIRSTGVFPILKTGSDGRFTLAPSEPPSVVVAAHATGFAVRTIEAQAGQLNAPIQINLKAWGRVEGVFKVGSRPTSNERISLFVSSLGDAPKIQVVWSVSTMTDAEGRFVFEHVLPTIVTINRTVPIRGGHALLVEDIPAFEVKPNETARLALGGVGRPVIGRIAIPPELNTKWDQVQPSVRITFEVHPPKPWEQLNGQEEARWNLEWRKTYRSYACLIHPDGSFRVDDVPPGTYELKLRVDEEYEERYPRGGFHGSRRVGGINRTITVPEILGGLARTDEPLDLGSLLFEFDRGPKVGELAPEFEATTLDGNEPIKLSDYRGKCVLIVFWNSSTAIGRPEAVALKAVASAFGHDRRFVMLGVSCDMQGDEAKSRIAELGWSWLQAKPHSRSSSSWDLRQKYAAYDLPSIWLIRRDGKVVAGDLKGAAIKEAVERAIRDN